MVNNLRKNVEKYVEWDYNIKVAGVSFHKDALEKLYYLDWDSISISLKLEPQNVHDSNAVAVYANDIIQLGYIPAMVAPHINQLITNGQQFKCALVYITDGKRGIRTAKIALKKE